MGRPHRLVPEILRHILGYWAQFLGTVFLGKDRRFPRKHGTRRAVQGSTDRFSVSRPWAAVAGGSNRVPACTPPPYSPEIIPINATGVGSWKFVRKYLVLIRFNSARRVQRWDRCSFNDHQSMGMNTHACARCWQWGFDKKKMRKESIWKRSVHVFLFSDTCEGCE